MNKPGQTNQKKGKDPICGMHVSPDSALRAEYQGHQYFFCSERCLQEFQKSPAYCAGEAAKTAAAEATDKVYICPCIPRSAKPNPASAPSAAWPLNPAPSTPKRKKIPNWWTCGAACGGWVTQVLVLSRRP